MCPNRILTLFQLILSTIYLWSIVYDLSFSNPNYYYQSIRDLGYLSLSLYPLFSYFFVVGCRQIYNNPLWIVGRELHDVLVSSDHSV